MAQQEAGVVAAGEEAVRAYLREQGMADSDITKYLGQAREGTGPARFSFGSDEAGLIPRYALSNEGDSLVLAEQRV